MRIDHHAYQRATRVAGFGLLLQAGIGLLLLIFGLTTGDRAFQFASLFCLSGVLVWLGLLIVFHQHKLERLEALEEDELAAGRSEAQSVFDRTGDQTRVAGRRLALMHRWLMPALSLVLILLLGGLGAWMLAYMGSTQPFGRAEERGWAVAICLACAAIAFIFSRFTAGMSKLPAWQNLRGGAAILVGNALVLVAVAVGIIFRFFENDQVIEGVAWAIPILVIGLGLEILLNLILNLYRPRIPGEVPRPAFDSKVLSLLAAPDNIVRSLNEAVNYQFGFDVTSSWGYQLLLRSFVSLIALGAVALLLLSTMVVVEPHQQAIRLRGGAIVDGRVHGSGVMWKWPWPFETAEVHDVTRVRSVHLTPRVLEDAPVNLWDQEEPPRTDAKIEPFLVGSPPEQAAAEARSPSSDVEVSAAATAPTQEDILAERVSESFALVDAEMIMQYRIKAEGHGLLEFLTFSPDDVSRRQALTDRERALRMIALKEVSQALSRLPLHRVLSPGSSGLALSLRAQVQKAMDDAGAGVEVLAIDLPMLRPSGSAAPDFEELPVASQLREQLVAAARGDVRKMYTVMVGDAALVDQVLAEIDRYNQMREGNRLTSDDPELIRQRQVVEDLLVKGAGQAAQIIAQAETDRWVSLMNKRSQASRVRSQLASYAAAPKLYAHREAMRLYQQHLPFMDKYIVAVDPRTVDVDIDMQKVNSVLDFAGASDDEVIRP